MKNRKCIKILLNITRQKWVMYKFNCWLNLCIKFMYKNFNWRIVFAQVTPNLKIIRRLAQVTPARGYLSEAGFWDFWPGNIFRIFYQIPLPGAQTQTHILVFFRTEIKFFSWSFSGSKLKIRSSYPSLRYYSVDKTLIFIRIRPSLNMKSLISEKYKQRTQHKGFWRKN